MKGKDCNKSPNLNFIKPSSSGVKSRKSNPCFDINHNAINSAFDPHEKLQNGAQFVCSPQLPSHASQKVVASVSENKICEHCNQSEEIVNRCSSEPLPNALKEDEVLNCIKTSYHNETPCLKLDNFRVYDEMRHLCAFDGQLLEDATCLYFSGFVQPFGCESSEIHDRYPCEDIGPIEEWWIDELSENTTKIGLSSANAYYYLEEPMPEYFSFFGIVREKVFLKKTVINILQKASHELDYDGLLNILSTITYDNISTITEDILLRNGIFICRQLQLFDNDADNDAKIISITPCIETLAKKVNYDFNDFVESDDSDDTVEEESDDENDDVEDIKGSRRRKPVPEKKCVMGRKKHGFIVTTPTVEKLLTDYLIRNSTDEPSNCKEPRVEAPKYGMEIDDETASPIVPTTSREVAAVVVERLSIDIIKSYMRNKVTDCQISEELPPSESNTTITLPTVREFKAIGLKRLNEDIVNFYLHKCCESSERMKYLERKVEDENDSPKCTIHSDLKISVGDFVAVSNSSSIARVQYLYESVEKKNYFHAHWFMRSIDTILADVGHANELFETNECEDVLLQNFCRVVSVEYVPIESDWVDKGNVKFTEKLNNNADPFLHFYYQKRFCVKSARFEDIEPESLSSTANCYSCTRKKRLESLEIPVIIQDSNTRNKVRWRNEEYRVGSCVFLNPNTIMKRQPREKDDSDLEEDYDEDLFPEKYRKKLTKKSRNVPCDPFDVAFICKIWTKKRRITHSSDVWLRVKKFYRPENTNLSKDDSRKLDLNLLYWSDEESTIKLSDIQGKCYVSYKENLNCSVDEWAKKGPYRFYFSRSYDRWSASFTPAPPFATNIGKVEGMDVENDIDVPPDYPTIAPLRSFDVFCGCGGITCGLEEANVAKCLWAVDQDPSSSHAFKLNFPDATVYNEDANVVLKAILENKTTFSGQALPQKGEVDILCGGPPCQGFSLLNRFRKSQRSKFLNNLVATLLSYCDHFKPKFFVMENVRYFVRHKSNVLKLTLNCLVRLGYQATFFVLQSGRFGIPQSRFRVIIIGARPGEILPMQPEYLHSLTVAGSFDMTMDDMKYSATAMWKTSAPYRMIDVYDAISDMPPVTEHERSYTLKPITHFQRQLRIRNAVEETVLKDHISFPLNPLIEKRISFIPKNSRCDWRDLPNIVVKLRDGTLTQKLQYTHPPKSPKGAFRGVCSCRSNGECSRKYRQRRTLIPWCLSHTASRNNQWAGSYSRLSFDHLFKTVSATVRASIVRHLLHPVDNRMVSIREYGRSVGFPDAFQFYGSVSSKYRQIGNCVAPPLSKAIGLEIKRAIHNGSKTKAQMNM